MITRPRYTVTWSSDAYDVQIRRAKSTATPVRTVSWQEFDPVDHLPRGSAVLVRHAAGPQLIARLASAPKAHDLRVSVAADSGEETFCGRVNSATAVAWADADVSAHPLLPLRAFAPGGDPAALAGLIGTIFDPRWYTVHDRPDRLSPLERKFGLEPRWDHRPHEGRHLLTSCWLPRRPGRQYSRDADFFVRLYCRHVGGGKSEAVAVRKTGRYFLKALVALWFDAYAGADSPTWAGDRLFVPRLLFDSTAIRAVQHP